jgi:hypothetical protein
MSNAQTSQAAVLDPILSGDQFGDQPCARCRAVVIVPARNEETSLVSTLDALRLQVELDGRPLDPERYEVLLLLNNCTDRSAAVAHRYAADHPELHLHVFERDLPPDQAHVGTARRALMDMACDRLEELAQREGAATNLHSAILSTDADTLVAPEWIASNLAEIGKGAEVVGGVIHLLPEDLESLDQGTRTAYLRDREFQRLVAKLESLLDPDPADPWPRHLEHFGASLACTPAIYRLSGGLPAVKPLEDVAFIDALRKVGARIRHAPGVHIYTSARLDGRAEVGLSGQLRIWRQQAADEQPHLVESAEWLEHRFSTLARLRDLNSPSPRSRCEDFPARWQDRLRRSQAEGLPTPRFLERLDCNSLIEELFSELPGEPAQSTEITESLERLALRITQLEAAPAHPA